jgi:hypothetical protein
MAVIFLSHYIAWFTFVERQIMKGAGRAAESFHSDLSGGVARIDVGDEGTDTYPEMTAIEAGMGPVLARTPEFGESHFNWNA